MSIEMNPLTERNSSQSAKEGREYIIVKDGNGGEYKVINLEWEGHAPREGIIELVPLKFAKGMQNAIRHHNTPLFSCIRDKKTGMRIGIPIGFDEKKNIIWQRMSVSGAEFLDLSIDQDRNRWICIKNGPFLKGSPNFLNSSKTVYEAVDKEKEANTFKVARRNRLKASEVAGTLVGEELIDIALMLGIDPKSMSSESLWVAVVKIAEDQTKDRMGKSGSDKFLEVYYSDTRAELTILRRGMNTGVLTETPDKGVNYNGLTLGFNEPEALRYLKEHPATKTSIDMLSRKTNDASTQAFAPSEPIVKDEKDAKLERLEKELADMRAQLGKANEIALEATSEEIIATHDQEFAALVKEGKELKIQGVHLIRDKEKLRAKIEEARKLLKN